MNAWLRAFRPLIALVAGFSLVPTAYSQAADPIITPNRVPDSQKPWLYQGSDIPPDADWHFGVLSNGLRYAVRHNSIPPGQVSIRVRIDAGSLMERDDERGFAHLIEHLSFRGSAYAGDLESKRIWQRLGVTFGSDSNAATSYTDTVYQLDLPNADTSSLDESMHLLAGMMREPDLEQTALDAERPVVQSELRERPGPAVHLAQVRNALFFQGQRYATRDPGGTNGSLDSATPASVRAFHDRWYRPSRTVIVISGDMDPAVLEKAVQTYFGDWKGKGPDPQTPDFGKPIAGGDRVASLTEPSMPAVVTLAYIRPWTVGDDTIVFNQRRMVDMIATRIINRRLESKARSGGDFLAASASLDDVSRSANITSVNIVPLGDDWSQALLQVRAIIQQLKTEPPTQDEIDREVNEIESVMKNSVDTERAQPSASQADDMVGAVDIHETLASPETSLHILQDAIAKGYFTPDHVMQAARKVFAGTAVRATVNAPKGDTQAKQELAAALDKDVSKLIEARKAAVRVTFDDLPAPGKPGKVVSSKQVVTDPPIVMTTFANGVRLLSYPNQSQKGRVFVRVRFGKGYRDIPADRMTPAWAGEIALMPSGIGKLDQEALDRLTGDRQVNVSFNIDDDAFELGGETTAADLPDELKLIAAKLSHPGWDPNPVKRARAGALAGQEAMRSSPEGILSRDLQGLLRDGDARWVTPTPEQIRALTPEAFRAFWEPRLATGPIEVEVFGDVDQKAIIAAVRDTLGALPPRKDAPADAAPVRFADHVTSPVVRYHEGRPDQAAAVIAWPTGGGSDDYATSRKLEVLAAVFRDRLLDQLRSESGVSYTPSVIQNWPIGLSNGGAFVAVGQVPPDKTDLFFKLARGIARDLATKPLTRDELGRSVLPLSQTLSRMSSGSQFWMEQAAGGSYDPKRLAAIGTIANDYLDVTPESIRALAARYLDPSHEWSMVVLPKPKAKDGDQAR